MYKFLPYMTNDLSIGLYDEEVNDIYHSAYGALTEAYDKFTNPVKDFIKEEWLRRCFIKEDKNLKKTMNFLSLSHNKKRADWLFLFW